MDTSKIPLYKSKGYALANEFIKPFKEVYGRDFTSHEIHCILQHSNVPTENDMYLKDKALILLRNHKLDNIMSKYREIPKPNFNNEKPHVPTVLGVSKKKDTEDMPEADMETISQMMIQNYQFETKYKPKRKIIISESHFDRLINEGTHNSFLLTEADSRIKKTEKIIRNAFNGILNVDDIVSSEDYYVNNNPNTTWLQYLIFNLRHTLGLMAKQDVALLPNAANIAYNDLHFFTNSQDLNKMTILRRMLDMIKSKPEDMQAFAKTQETFDSLYQTYGKDIENADAEMRDRINNKEYDANSNYEIIRIKNREQAYEYGKYSGINGESALCYTTGDKTWNNFTNGGLYTCYLCLRKDWKEIPCKETEGYPKDEYGTSMIFLFVDENGELKYSNSRWNHGNHRYGNVDTMFTAEEISDIIGVNFYQTFKPNNKWQEIVNNAIQRLKNGESPNDVFDFCFFFYGGYARILLNKKCNFIDTNKNIVSPNLWFDECDDFYNGYAAIKINGKSNFIDTKGNILSPNRWFDHCYRFINGYGTIESNKQINFIDTEGNILSPNLWFDECFAFNNGFARVGVNEKYNFVNIEGNILSPNLWFDRTYDFNNGFAMVKLSEKYNFISTEGNILSPNQWFDECWGFKNGLARVNLNNKYNFINADGKFISNQWFDDCRRFENGFAMVALNNQIYKIDERGNLYDINELSETITNILKKLLT